MLQHSCCFEAHVYIYLVIRVDDEQIHHYLGEAFMPLHVIENSRDEPLDSEKLKRNWKAVNKALQKLGEVPQLFHGTCVA